MTLQEKRTAEINSHCARYDRIRDLYNQRHKVRISALYPDTGGNPGLFHNWYRCSRDNEVSARADEFLQVEYAIQNKISKRSAREWTRLYRKWWPAE